MLIFLLVNFKFISNHIHIIKKYPGKFLLLRKSRFSECIKKSKPIKNTSSLCKCTYKKNESMRKYITETTLIMGTNDLSDKVEYI